MCDLQIVLLNFVYFLLRQVLLDFPFWITSSSPDLEDPALILIQLSEFQGTVHIKLSRLVVNKEESQDTHSLVAWWTVMLSKDVSS